MYLIILQKNQFYRNISHMWSSVSYQTLKKRKKDINRKVNTVLAGWGNEKAKCILVKERKIISQKMNKR